jgi:hypothetical protein
MDEPRIESIEPIDTPSPFTLCRRAGEVAAWLATVSPDLRERFEERAAIREYDGEQPRPEAEWKTFLAYKDLNT